MTAEERPARRGRARSIAIWSAVALAGAVSWGIVALARGEQISAVWLIFAALGSYAIAYRFYARFIARRVLGVDDRRATPAERLDKPLPTTEVPFVESKLTAPSGLIPTAEERERERALAGVGT